MKEKGSSLDSIQLARHLGLFDATMIGVGAMIGAGIFVLTGIAAGNAGPAAILAFALNGVVTLFSALSYAELASAVPEAGGGYSFIKKVMPNFMAFAAGWMLWFAYIVACSLYARGFASYFLWFAEQYIPAVGRNLMNGLGEFGSVALLTLIVSLFFIGVNIAGTHTSGKMENVITLAKIVVLGVFVGFGLKKALTATAMVQDNFRPFLPLGAGGVLAAMGLTFIAFEGYDLIATVSEEVKDPRRTIPRAILYSLSITMAVYLLVIFVCIGSVSPSGGLQPWRILGESGETGIIRAAQSFMPKFGIILVLAGGVFATLSALNATILASSRVAFSMGRDWMLPNSLSRIHSKKRTPVLAISISGALFIAISLFLPLETIGVASSLLFLLTFSLVNAALILYRRRSAEKPSFRVPLFPLTPVLGILTSFGLSIYQLFHQRAAWALAMGWIALGLAIYGVAFARRVNIADVPKVILSPELRDLKKKKRYKVLVPLANPARLEPLIQIAGGVAGGCLGEILCLNVVELPNITSYSEAEPYLDDVQNLMSRAQRIAMSQNVPFSSLMKIGRSAAAEIVQVGKESLCHLILLGYKKEEDPLENSLIHHVIAHQPCDIAVLKCGTEKIGPLERLLVPIGGREIHDQLKARIVHCLSKGRAEKVTLMKVIPPQGSRAAFKRTEEDLKRAAKIYGLPGAHLLVEENAQTAEAIVQRAGEHDLLILGMRDEPWFRAFFFGTLAQQIAGQVQCPTILTKAHAIQRTKMKRLLNIPPAQTCAAPPFEK